MNHPVQKEAIYRHLSFRGTPYEIGRKEAEYIKINDPEYAGILFHGNEFIKPSPLHKVRDAIKMFEEYCPNINREIAGFAGCFNRAPEDIVYYSFSHVGGGSCSHFAVLPQKTADNNTYVGRSYEWDENEDKCLLTVKAEGMHAHLGFGLLLFGRYDGINEKGLCVTMSNSVPLVMSDKPGLRFWAVIRILLDTCETIDEAIGTINRLPVSSFCNLIITDRSGEAVLAEIHNRVKTFKRISPVSNEGYVCSTNHYTLPDMLHLVKNKMQHSMDRYHSITRTLDADTIDRESLKKLLSAHMPDGLSCHYYHDGLGTLWSILYNVTALQAEICFGSPTVNGWYEFDLNSPEGTEQYRAILPDMDSDPQTWKRIQ